MRSRKIIGIIFSRHHLSDPASAAAPGETEGKESALDAQSNLDVWEVGSEALEVSTTASKSSVSLFAVVSVGNFEQIFLD